MFHHFELLFFNTTTRFLNKIDRCKSFLHGMSWHDIASMILSIPSMTYLHSCYKNIFMLSLHVKFLLFTITKCILFQLLLFNPPPHKNNLKKNLWTSVQICPCIDASIKTMYRHQWIGTKNLGENNLKL